MMFFLSCSSTSRLDHGLYTKWDSMLSMDNVCNRRLFSIPSKVEMAEEQEYL